MVKLIKISRLIKKMFAKTPMLKFVFAWYYKHTKIKENQVLFESFHGKNISDSPLALLFELLKMNDSKQYKVYFASNNIKRDKKVVKKLNLKINLVDVSTFKYTKVLATSKYLINNCSFPTFFIRRTEQVYLHLWHGTPVKTLGKSMRFGIESMYNVQHDLLQSNYILFPNEFTKKIVMEDYNLENLYTGKVVINGNPKNSIFMDKNRSIEATHKLGNDKYTVIAYLPTWNGSSNYDINRFNQKMQNFLTVLDNHLKHNQKFYINLHQISNVSLSKQYKHIFPFPKDIEQNEFLNSVDIFITDYSSIMFDFAVTKKPIVLFLYDFEKVVRDRGIYIDIDELPFEKIYNFESLKNYILEEKYNNYFYDYNKRFIKTFLPYNSIDSAKNISRLIFDNNNCGMPIIEYSLNKNSKKIAFYPTVQTKEDLHTVIQVVKDTNEIVIFNKKYFNSEISNYFSNHCSKKFDFIFITENMPRTFLEEICKNKRKEELHRREIKRNFGELYIDPQLKKDYYHGEVNETFCLKTKKVANVRTEIKNGKLEILLDNTEIKGEISKLLILDKSKKILWTRSISNAEIKNKKIVQDFSNVVNKAILFENKRYYLMVEVKCNTGSILPYYLIDADKFKEKRKTFTELNKSSLYMEALDCNNAWIRNKNEASIKIIPYMTSGKGYLSIFVGNKEKLMSQIIRGKVLSYKLGYSDIKLRMKIKQAKILVKDVVLSYRNNLKKIEYSFKYNIKADKDDWIIEAYLDLKEIEFEELFWDIYIIVEFNGEEMKICPYLNEKQRKRMRVLSKQCKVKTNHIVFPYSTMGHKLALTYRESSKYDGWNTKIKEFVALFVNRVCCFYWNKKRIWLVFEKFCLMAQDNGYYFFKYCMENLPKEEKSHIYFVIDRNSSDWDRMKKYGSQVIAFMSFKHILYALASKIYVGSDSKKHLYIWRAKPNLISKKISKKNILFLQHGVTALKKVDNIFGQRGSSPMTYFAVTSGFEQGIVVDNFGYKPQNVPILGFTRWDVLEDTSKKDERIILVMPTWRSWLEEKSVDEFKKSDYYSNYMKMLQSKKLAKILEENHVKLVFYIHPKFKDYLNEFNISKNNIEIIPFGKEPLNEIIKRCSMLITDYSSVCWDVFYLKKPVLFYQFDYTMYMQAHGSYLDMEHDLFGDRYTEYEDLIQGIERYIRNNFKEHEKYVRMRNYYFEYRDHDNSKRTYEYIIGKGY